MHGGHGRSHAHPVRRCRSGVPGSGVGVLAAMRTSVPVGLLAGKSCDEVDPEKKAAKRKEELERAKNAPKPAWYKDLKNPRAGMKGMSDGMWNKIKPGVWNCAAEMGAVTRSRFPRWSAERNTPFRSISSRGIPSASTGLGLRERRSGEGNVRRAGYRR